MSLPTTNNSNWLNWISWLASYLFIAEAHTRQCDANWFRIEGFHGMYFAGRGMRAQDDRVFGGIECIPQVPGGVVGGNIQ